MCAQHRSLSVRSTILGGELFRRPNTGSGMPAVNDMTAAIIQLSDYQSRRTLPDHHRRMEEARAIIKDAIARTITEDYAGLPIVTVSLAIAEANSALDEDGSFADAVEASSVVLRQAMAEAAITVLHAPLWEMGYLKAASSRVVAAVLRERWTAEHRPAEDYHYALCRARRIIDGGGCINIALYQALGDPGGECGVTTRRKSNGKKWKLAPN
ncbi:MAG: hypothetical protein MZW92_32030 [Comamonadaceae bacterium]|nr:hypothetical protein [Comamonadaceae bacterium]